MARRGRRIRAPDGEKWICDRAFPIRDEAGVLIRIAGIAEDVTEKRRYQEELVRASMAADEANHAKSRLLANTSPEIRTPMNGVIGMARSRAMTDTLRAGSSLPVPPLRHLLAITPGATA